MPASREESGRSGRPATAAQPGRRLKRPERREQILDAATRAFSQAGFTATGLDDIAVEAGVSRVILYRHFDSKSDLYRAVLDRACTRLITAVGADKFTSDSIPALLQAASADPEGFRLLFRHAAREPEFRDQTDRFSADAVAVTYTYLAQMIPEQKWARWAAQLVPTVAIEAVLAWLDAGSPDPEIAGERIRHAVEGVIAAVQPPATAS